MHYLDFDALKKLDAKAFQTQHPYPWINPYGLLTDEGFQALRTTLPEVEHFERSFGEWRHHGQRPHDRLFLDYTPGMPLSSHWQAFLDELQGFRYRRFMARMLGTSMFRMGFHWHYTPASCSVSPHCDDERKLGSQIFYFNSEEDWRPEWGGQTVVLDDAGRFAANSAPEFADFDSAIESRAMGNHSFIFSRRGNSWHGVREITCPPNHYRKVFIVVVRERHPVRSFYRVVKRKILPAASLEG
ncbi:hypothetical protein SAMN02745148_03379 [Modicisalibacter ilicicola DSM 19980]|uniref:2OG-Fe(II) oxygenase superfamily protein n=1 Tax=Modicisalibacter ilicicola DSM 19980 TaxID=1121942 RepID=A0A1M5DY65_9GAMM|nr:hypothetical protein [Halomonas ilicicola]SHF71947.1 hypothetical protein SAMN02745148_03379 [Halomonas ilicicola DSM 19980]